MKKLLSLSLLSLMTTSVYSMGDSELDKMRGDFVPAAHCQVDPFESLRKICDYCWIDQKPVFSFWTPEKLKKQTLPGQHNIFKALLKRMVVQAEAKKDGGVTLYNVSVLLLQRHKANNNQTVFTPTFDVNSVSGETVTAYGLLANAPYFSTARSSNNNY